MGAADVWGEVLEGLRGLGSENCQCYEPIQHRAVGFYVYKLFLMFSLISLRDPIHSMCFFQTRSKLRLAV